MIQVILFSIQFVLLCPGYVSAVVTGHAFLLLMNSPVFALKLTVVTAEIASVVIDSSI